MPRPITPSRNSLNAARSTSNRSAGVSSLPGVGDAQSFGPSPSDIGQGVIQKSEGEDGTAIVSIRFSSPLMKYVREGDLREFKALMETMRMTAIAMSRGPYSLKQLAQMGHPYAKNKAVIKPKPTSTKSHNVPRFQPSKAIGHVKGIRGSVPTLAVTNVQSGHFADSWETETNMDAGGLTGILRNVAEYAFYLMDGTDKMIAHGAFEYAIRLFAARLNAAWAAIITTAWRRQPAQRGMGKAAITTIRRA